MDLGNEIKRDVCPEKYYKKNGFVKDTLPALIAIVVVALIAGIMMGKSGANILLTVIIELIFVGLATAFMTVFMSSTKKRVSQQHISVCDNGICGVCPVNGFKNRRFKLAYSDIKKINSKGDKLNIYSDNGNISIIVSDAEATAALIDKKISEGLEKDN